MKVLVVGSGGREHAIAWRLAQSPRIQLVYVAPGNAGTATHPNMCNVPVVDTPALIAFVRAEGINLTVVGPEIPLANGIVDEFRAAGLKIFGPTRAAAQLESSKDFAKNFMRRHGIPTAAFKTFTDAASAKKHVAEKGAPIVIKADGLAAGKGVVVAVDTQSANDAIEQMFSEYAQGARVVVEEFLAGEEASFIVMVDGHNILPLATSQDHKRLLDGDQGPNTGGMGAYSPAPVVTPELHARVMREIIVPTVSGMAADGIPFSGFLYAGLMIDANGSPRALEFNCRMGDPETQPIMARLKSDLLAVFEHATAGTLDKVSLEWDRRTALCVVMAAEGYPGAPKSGAVISGIPVETDDSVVFHAGTRLADGKITVTGGRVLGITALGDSVRVAQRRAYETLEAIHFEGAQWRRDIGWRALNKRH
jgi:phosphoribosylamine---glycine ligase